MKILAISGSLRAASINSAFCRATAALAPPDVQVHVLSGLGELALFNPDLEPSPPAAVRALRVAIQGAGALVIASPEYARGISGVMKNALDWLVSFEGTVGKPIALINTSARAHHAHAALRQVLLTMSTQIVETASVTLPLLGTCTREEEMIRSAQVSGAIRQMIQALTVHVAGHPVPAANFPVT